MIQIEKCTSDEINIDKTEVLRYLGYNGQSAPLAVCDAIERCMAEILPKLSYRACFDRFLVTEIPNGNLSLSFIETNSKNLAKNLKDCNEVILFTATVGIELDRIMQKYSALSPLNATISQAIGTAAIEKWCDVLCERFAVRERDYGNFLRPRFSPGYGDFPLETQKRIFEVLDCNRKIGVTLTDSLLMMPSKSVSAIIGVSKNNLRCTPHGCEICKNTECQFRRG